MKEIRFNILPVGESGAVFDSDAHDFSEIINRKDGDFRYLTVGDAITLFGAEYEIAEGGFKPLGEELWCLFYVRRV